MGAILKHICFVRVEVLRAVTQVVSESVILNEVITLTTKVSVVYTIHLVSLKSITATMVKNAANNAYKNKWKHLCHF